MSQKNTMEEVKEEGISPVTQVRKPSMNVKTYFSLAAAGIVIVSLASMVITRWQAQRRQEAAGRHAADQVATASSAGAQPLKIVSNPAGLPPVTGGVQPLALGAPSSTGEVHIPPLDPGTADVAPIGVFADQSGAPALGLAGSRAVAPGLGQAVPSDPFDAPVLLSPAVALQDAGRVGVDAGLEDGMAQARAHLEETRARLEKVIESVRSGQGTAPAQFSAGAVGAASGPGSREDVVKMSSTGRIGAARVAAPALTLPRGMTFSCALASKIVSEQTGPVSCVVSRNVFGADGRVLLIERGSHLDGAYSAQVRVGQSRISVLWERLRMPNGVVVDLASPATGALGEAGVGGFVDNHWSERIGAALLLSMVDDAVKIEVAREQSKGNSSGTVLLQGSGSETSTLAGKVLDSTINIPPTIVKNQGEIVAVNVAQDVDFSTVYELRASTLPATLSTTN